MMRLGLLTLLLFFASGGSEALAFDLCAFYKKSLPALYDAVCGTTRKATKPAGANSSFASTFDLNPSALPNEPSSYGIETIGSYIRTNRGAWSPSFSLVKGFSKFGTGISSSSDNTFYSNDVLRRVKGHSLATDFKPIEAPEGKYPNFNLGNSFKLAKGRKDTWKLSLGTKVRYLKVTNSIGGGPGLMYYYRGITIGAGVSYERVSNFLPGIYFTSALLGFKLFFLEFEYNVLKNIGGRDLQPVHIATATFGLPRLYLTVAARHLNYMLEGEVTQYHLAAQYIVSKRISIGYMYNYIPGANSFGLQLYL